MKRPVQPRRPGSRTALRVLVGALVVAALLWGADTAARVAAESLIARDVQDATGVTVRPDVHVHGIVFLPQVIRGAYNEVDVTTVGLTNGSLRFDRLDSRLLDVRVPFHDVLVRDVRAIGIGESIEQVTVTYPDVNSYLQKTGRGVRLAAAEGGQTRISGSVDILGVRVQAAADVRLFAAGGQVRVSPEQIDTGDQTMSSARRLLLRQRLSFALPTDSLPFGHQLSQITSDEDGLQVTARGRGLVLQP